MNTARSIPSLKPLAAAPIPLPIRILRRLQPLIAALLASPIHGLLSRDVLLLEYAGRKSGRHYELPLSYVGKGKVVYLCTRPEGSQWWRNLKNGADVRVRLRGRTMQARATILDPASAEALEGLRAFLARNPRTGEMLYHVSRGAAGQPDQADLEREVAASVVVRIEPGETGAQGPGAGQAAVAAR